MENGSASRRFLGRRVLSRGTGNSLVRPRRFNAVRDLEARISVSCEYGTDGSSTPTIVAGRSLSRTNRSGVLQERLNGQRRERRADLD